MRFLTQDESKGWLAPSGGVIDNIRRLSFREGIKSLTGELPNKPLKLAAFLERSVDWLPRGNERLLWLSDWTTYPPQHFDFFEQIRVGFGERRRIMEAPGCVFVPDNGSVNQEFSEVPDTTTLIGFLLLTVSFDWQAYIVVEKPISYVFFDDEKITFCSVDSSKLADAGSLFSRFKLKPRTTA